MKYEERAVRLRLAACGSRPMDIKIAADEASGCGEVTEKNAGQGAMADQRMFLSSP